MIPTSLDAGAGGADADKTLRDSSRAVTAAVSIVAGAVPVHTGHSGPCRERRCARARRSRAWLADAHGDGDVYAFLGGNHPVLTNKVSIRLFVRISYESWICLSWRQDAH